MRQTINSATVFGLIMALFLGSTVIASANSSHNTVPGIVETYTVFDDSLEPEVTAKVARISFLVGNAKVKHAESNEWETVVFNLPVVEGDEFVTDAGSRVEIQFDKDRHIRLSENTHLRVVTLKDEGIALSTTRGSISLRVAEFQTDGPYCEIDAPNTTLAVQSSGTYRVDAGETEVRFTATDGGEARLYSANAGFTLRNGRSSRIFIDGPNSGEWETTAASRHFDEFDRWAENRNETIAKSLKNAYYDQYYDDEIYGADDLNNFGNWIHTTDYGYIWRPSSIATRSYSDWSPYRYGHWRWRPPFGWVWVNDEPWGWATYHYGRWIYHRGSWYWSPYGYYRTTRSWWYPALVSITIINNNICWYPLGYRHRYNNFNRRYTAKNPRNPVLGTGREVPKPTLRPRGNANQPIGNDVPPGAVVITDRGSFGTKTAANTRPPLAVAKTALGTTPNNNEVPELPRHRDINPNISRDILADKPRISITDDRSKVGAAQRRAGEPLDKDLKTTRILGGREPQVLTPSDPGSPTRQPGVFTRPEPSRQTPVRTPPASRPLVTQTPSTRTPPTDEKPTQVRPPVKTPPAARTPPATQRPPSSPPPTAREPVRQPPARQQPAPRQEPPKARETPRAAPPKEAPKQKAEPPAQKEPVKEKPA